MNGDELLYLAGPMTGLPEFNFPAFFEGAGVLERAGFRVGNPAKWDEEKGMAWEGTNGTESMADLGMGSLAAVLLGDLDFIANESDGIALLPGWERSKGVAAEVALAKALGLPVKTVNEWLGVEEPIAPIVQLHNAFIEKGDEVRITSATGGQKGAKLGRLGSLDPQSLIMLSEVSGFGAQKYAAHNFLKGYDWSLSFDAMTRHMLAFWNAEDNDPESGLPHVGHVAWHALCLASFQMRGLGTDDRFKQAVA